MSGPISPPLTVTTVGGTPSGRPITTLRVSNGDLTISGNTATIDTSGGGGGGGSVTSITFSSPLTGGTITTTGTVGIPEANGSTDGYLSSTAYNTFDGKQDEITLTTTGTSGNATLVGSTLNIPNYTNTATIGGSIANTQVAYGSGANTIQGSANLTFDGTNLNVAGYVKAGSIYIGNGTGQLETIGANDLILQTNEGTNSGTLTIKNGVNGNAVFQPTGTGAFQFNGVSGGEDGRIMLMCSEGTHSQTISSAPHASASTYELVLPTGLPADADNKYLVSDTSGNMSFTSASGGGGGGIGGSISEDQVAVGSSTANEIEGNAGYTASLGASASTNVLKFGYSDGTVGYTRLRLNGSNAYIEFRDASDNQKGAIGFQSTQGLKFYSKAGGLGATEALRITPDDEWILNGTNTGTSGQVLTSGGSGAAVSWTTPSGGGINWPNSISTYTGTFGYGDNLGIGFNGRLSTQSPNLGQWANSTIRYRPWICMKEGNLDNWYIWVGGVPTGGSDQTWSVGLWNVGSDNVPGTLKCTSDITISSSTGVLSGTWTAEAGQDLAVKMGDTYWVGYYSTYGSSAESANLYWFTGAQVTAFPGRRPNANTGNTSDPCRVYGSSGDIATIGDNPTITGSDTQTTTGWPIMWYSVS